MDVVLFNDTANNPHMGCLAVTDAFNRLFARAGAKVIDRFYNRELRPFAQHRRPTDLVQALLAAPLADVIRAADAVVVNGEGTIHHGRGRELLGVLLAAAELGRPALLVNAVLEELPDLHEALRGAAYVSVRDAASGRYLEALGVGHEVHPDVVIEAGFAHETSGDFRDRILVTDWHIQVDNTVGAALRAFVGGTHRSVVAYPLQGQAESVRWRHAVADFGAARAAVVARHHGAYFAALAGTPFVMLRSNTHKMEGFIAWAGLPIPMCTTPDEIEAGLERVLAERDMFRELQARLLAARPLPLLAALGGVPARLGASGPVKPAALPVERVLACAQSDDPQGAALICADRRQQPGFARELLALAHEARRAPRLGVALERLAELAPGAADLHVAAGAAWKLLGDLPRALDCYGRAIDCDPRCFNARYFRALALSADQQWPAAERDLEAALELEPRSAKTLARLGEARLRNGRRAAGLAALREAVRIEPANAELRFQLAISLLDHGKVADGCLDEAVAEFDRCLELRPGHTSARYHSGLARIHTGDLAEGWRRMEARWQMEPLRSERRPFPLPEWNGVDALAGRLLIWSEEAPGVGVQVMFAGLIPELTARGVRCALEVSPRLAPLLERSLPGVEVIPRGSTPDPRTAAADLSAQIACGSLAQHLRSNEAAFARRSAYLVPDAARRAACRRRYAQPGVRLVGISWRTGNPGTGGQRSVPLDQWGPILSTPGCRFISLQYGDVAAEVDTARRAGGADIVLDPAVDPLDGLDPLVAQIAALDLVISIDNSTVHFAGALGVDCWCLMPEPCYWQWPAAGEDSRWYPSLRLLRQVEPGEWGPVLAQAAARLGRWAAGGE